MSKNALLKEYKLEQVSDIETKFYLADLVGYPSEKIIVISFSGDYKPGSEGNKDALYMTGMIRAALTVWSVKGMVLDFSNLKYSWGDMMSMVLASGDINAASDLERELAFGGDSKGLKSIPMSVAASDINFEGLKSLSKGEMDINFDGIFFKSLELAIKNLIKMIGDNRN